MGFDIERWYDSLRPETGFVFGTTATYMIDSTACNPSVITQRRKEMKLEVDYSKVTVD